jgi:hypothetical protein
MSEINTFGEHVRATWKRRTKVAIFALLALGGGVIGGRMNSSEDIAQNSELEIPIIPAGNPQTVSSGGSPTGDLTTTAIAPIRIVDTRPGSFTYGGVKVPWGAEETRSVQAAGLSTIPSDAVGIVVNITALNATTKDTFLTVFPTGSQRPAASTLNPVPGEIAFNAATVLLSNGTFDVYNYSGTVDLIIDVTAYLTRNIADDVLELQSLTPVMVDSDGKRFATLYTDSGWVVKVNDYWLVYGNEGFQKESNLLFTSSNCSGTPYVDESSVSGFRPDSYGVMPVARIYQEVEGPVSVLQLATELSESTIGDIRSIRSTAPALPFLDQSWQQNGMGCLFRSVSGPIANFPASQVAYPLTISPLVDPPSPPFRVEVSEN